MKQVYIRRSPSRGETTSAALLAVGLGAVVGAVAFYFTRAFHARDAVPPLAEASDAELDREVEGPR